MAADSRSEEHTSELQSLRHLVCRLLLEKKNPPPRSAAGGGLRRRFVAAAVRSALDRVPPCPRCLRPASRLVQASGVPCLFFFFNDTATTEIYTLSLHDALPIWFPGDDVPVIRGSALGALNGEAQ